MDPLRFLVDQHGFFSRHEAADLGYDDRAVARAVRNGAWFRIRRGAYTFTEIWQGLDAVGRHQVRSAAVMRSLGPKVALSHVSGALRHGVDVWGVDLQRVHVTRLDGAAGRIEGDVVHHEGLSLPGELREVGGARVLPVERCVLEAGSRAGGEAALVLFNSMLCKQLASIEELQAMHAILQHWPFMRRVQVPLRLADPGAQSVGESRGLWLFWVHHVPRPVTQYEVRATDGELIGITDWAWPEHNGLGEFDGRLKYGRALRPGQDPGAVVFAEKQREDRIREVTGMNMVRLVWSDLERPNMTAARVQKMLRVPA